MKLPPPCAAFAAASAFVLSLAQPSVANDAPVLRPFALLGNPPPVQMLVPGFVVRELPVDLTNVNNLTYAPDGRLFAYAYNGSVYQLHDTDGDGLEDKYTVYYKNEREVFGGVGMTWGPNGLYITSRKQILHLRERGDGTAEAVPYATGWPEPDRIAGRYLDTFGLAFDRDGNLFFGLGISDIRNAYRINPETGVSTYSRTWDRGTIQKWGRDGKREIFATGVRFTIALAFNAAGDLFCTDQEGATWLPNGNPFDELLHLQPGRHYGFPPRHPKYNPDAIDEPSLFDYGPQHISACGLKFNEPRKAGDATFGPDWWRGDAFVAGQSRGILFRTKLVKTAAGYIARTENIAYTSGLLTDIEPSPTGDLVLTCHSGRPDNGTGPTGPGKLYKISYRERSAPQPILAYPASPMQTAVVFDRPIPREQIAHYAAQANLIMGEYVGGGDRFNSFVPGYQAVKDQQKVPRHQLPVTAVRASPDRRTLLVHTASRTRAVHYSLGFNDSGQPGRPHDAGKHETRQQSAVDLHFDLNGVHARFDGADDAQSWEGWLPHFDLTLAEGFVAPSADHAALFQRLKTPGTLHLAGQLNLHSLLHPAVQPGSKLDFTYPPETVTVRVSGSGPVALKTAAGARAQRVSDTEWHLVVDPATADLVPLEASLQTTAGVTPRLDVTWSTNEDARPRALALHRVLMPWATREEKAAWVGVRGEIPEIAGGNWAEGRKLFFGKATCSVCHRMNGEGATLGPDLSNLVHRDYASVMHDIMEPSATLNPEYLAVTLEKKDGTSVGGTLLQNWNQVYILGQPNGQTITIPRDEVVSVKNLGISLMPPGLLHALSEQERRDLLTYLLREAPSTK